MVFARLVIAATLGGAALAGLGLLLPPLHVLTHEFSQGFTAIGGLLWLFTVRELSHRRTFGGARRSPQASDHTLLWAALTGVFGAGLGAMAVHIGVDGPLHGCRTEPGLAFFWITWLPLGVLGSVVGVVAGQRGWRRRTLLLIVFLTVLSSAAHDLLQVVLGVRQIDPLLGSPDFLDQRSGLSPDALMVTQRGWLLGVALSVWLMASWRQPVARPERAMPAITSAALMLLITVFWGSRLGLGWGQAPVRATLNGLRSTPHFDLHYRLGGDATLAMDLIEREAEWQWHSVAPDMLPPGESPRVDLYLYDDTEQMEQLTGTAAAHAWIHRVDMPWWNALSSTLRHELVHALHFDVHPSWRVALNRGLLEGTAEAWEDGLVWDRAAHVQAAALLANGDLPPASAFMAPLGFFQLQESAAYQAAGSFMGWLVLSRGLDRFWELHRSLDFPATYGEDLSALDAEWRVFLAQVPVDIDTLRRGRSLFDQRRHPGYAGRACPKVGRSGWTPRRRAKALERRQAFAAAATITQGLWEQDSDPADGLEAAQQWIRAGEAERARALVQRVLQIPDLGPDQRVDLRHVELHASLLLQDWARADAELALISTLPDQDPVEIDGVRALLGDPQLRPTVSRLLSGSSAEERRQEAAILHGLRPEDPTVRRLTARYGLDLPHGSGLLGLSVSNRADLAFTLEQAAQSADDCDALDVPLSRSGVLLVRLGELDLAQQVARVLASPCTRGTTHLSARRLSERIAWEREARER